MCASLRAAAGREDYEAIGKKAFGRKAQLTTTLLIAILTWLCLIAYAVLIGDLLTPVLKLLGLSVGVMGRKLVIICAVLCVSPLCFKRTLTALRFGSLVTVCSITLVTCCIIYRSITSLDDSPRRVFSGIRAVCRASHELSEHH